MILYVIMAILIFATLLNLIALAVFVKVVNKIIKNLKVTLKHNQELKRFYFTLVEKIDFLTKETMRAYNFSLCRTIKTGLKNIEVKKNERCN